MTFIDSNVPMYLVGAGHPLRTAAELILQRLIAGGEKLVTDAEAIQEILHRFVAIRRPAAIEPAVESLLGLVDEVYAVEKSDVIRAIEIWKKVPEVSARDALHAAIMARHRIPRILSFDADFDRFPDLLRIHSPAGSEF